MYSNKKTIRRLKKGMVVNMSDKKTTFSSTSQYVASKELLASVNVAVALQKPLLIKGEPGTGKTMLAQAVAESLGKKLVIWNIKSTTKAQEGLYVYDTIQRLYDGREGHTDKPPRAWSDGMPYQRRQPEAPRASAPDRHGCRSELPDCEAVQDHCTL